MAQQKVGVDKEVLSDAQLIALLCQMQEELETYGESNELCVLVRDFATELLKWRLFARRCR